MNKNKSTKNIIIIFASVFFVLFIALACRGIYVSTIHKREKQVKDYLIENARRNAYSMKFVEDNKACIEKENVKYYYLINPTNVTFYSCEYIVKDESENIKDGNVEITITDLGSGKINVFYHDTRTMILDDGTEEYNGSCGNFTSNAEFDKESFYINYFVPDAEHKTLEDYNSIMKFTTVEELKKHYNEALSICEVLNS